MVIEMLDAKLATLSQIREFMAGTADVPFRVLDSRAERYALVRRLLARLGWTRLRRADKTLLKAFLAKLTGLSRAQLTRLIGQHVRTGRVRVGYRAPASAFRGRFDATDVAALVELDAAHETLSGPAARRLCQRAWQGYGDARYQKLASTSVAHLYNLRKRASYRAARVAIDKTRSRPTTIGIRRAPQPDGRAGFIRIDTVHQGDADGAKGVYHLNAVDCVTQWQLAACCERISEAYLLPVIGLLLQQFPFVIHGLHSDGGSEFVNHDVARLLEKLRVEFTRSRPRQCNDNALVEAKNGVVIRRIMGYGHIPQHHAAAINAFCAEHLNPYVNLHRPCLFGHEQIDHKGRARRRYDPNDVRTPLERLAELPSTAYQLKPGVTLDNLLNQARTVTDNNAERALRRARAPLFQSINRRSHRTA
jgi:transposase InsO family protein